MGATRKPFWDRSEGTGYTAFMFAVYEYVVAMGLPTNLDINQWSTLVDNSEDKQIVEFLQYEIPVCYQGPFPSPPSANHPSTNRQPKDLAMYITTELGGQDAMLGPFDGPQCQPWCQINPLLTKPKKHNI